MRHCCKSFVHIFNPRKTHWCLPEVGVNLQRWRHKRPSVPYHVTINGWGPSQRCRELAQGLLAFPPRRTKRLPPLADAELTQGVIREVETTASPGTEPASTLIVKFSTSRTMRIPVHYKSPSLRDFYSCKNELRCKVTHRAVMTCD